MTQLQIEKMLLRNADDALFFAVKKLNQAIEYIDLEYSDSCGYLEEAGKCIEEAIQSIEQQDYIYRKCK